MSKRTDIQQALITCIASVRPGLVVVGADSETAIAARITAPGRVIVGTGDPGEPEVDLSPRTYWYDHPFPIEVAMLPEMGKTAERTVADLLAEIEAAVLSDVTIAALCEYVEFTAPTSFDVASGERGASGIAKGADLSLVAIYGTPTPLT